MEWHQTILQLVKTQNEACVWLFSHGFIVGINFCGFFIANSFKDIAIHVSHLAL